MRRALVTALAVPALLLSACGDDPEVQDVSPEQSTEADLPQEPVDAAETTEEPADETESTEEASDAAETTDAPTEEAPSDAGSATQAPADGSETTAGAGAGEVEGGAEGQAAADRTKEWLMAFVSGDESVCDMMLDLDSKGPMPDNETHYEVCTTTLPAQANEQFGPEQAQIFEAVEITGADVQGDTAIVDKDNFSDIFATAIGDMSFTLKKIDGTWYVDLNASEFGQS